MRVCVVAILLLLTAWYFSPAFHDTLATTLVLGLCLFFAVMGAWHDGHAIGEKEGRESGNALILILIAIVLFAALTAAMNQGSRSSTGMLSDQQANLYAMDIIQYGNTIKQAVKRMQMKGISEEDFSFENTVFATNDGTLLSLPEHFPNCASDDCKVYHPAGGGVTARYPPEGSALNIESPDSPSGWRAGAWWSMAAAMEGVGTDLADVALVSYYLRKEVCTQINNLHGVTNPGGNPPVVAHNYKALYTPGGIVETVADGFSGGSVSDHASYCFEITGRSGVYAYITALIVR